MTDNDTPGSFSLRRWSRRKLEAARVASPKQRQRVEPDPAHPVVPSPPGEVPVASPAASPAAADAATAPLPPVDSLVFESDFTPFLRPKVDETVKREALKKLFQDPRFNVMDRLDVYIDDYSLPDPISPEVVRQLLHMKSFFAPPKTRVNAQGYVEDVPPDEDAPPAAPSLPPPDDATPSSPVSAPDGAAVQSAAHDDSDPVPPITGQANR